MSAAATTRRTGTPRSTSTRAATPSSRGTILRRGGAGATSTKCFSTCPTAPRLSLVRSPATFEPPIGRYSDVEGSTEPLRRARVMCRSARVRGGALEEQLALPCVPGERCRALALRPCFVETAELRQEVAAHARQEVVAPEGRLRGQRIDELEARCRTECHRDRDRAIQLDDGGGREPGERLVELRDTRPVGLRRRTRSCVTGGDRGLQRVRPLRAAERLGPLERHETTTDEDVIPARPVLIEQQ